MRTLPALVMTFLLLSCGSSENNAKNKTAETSEIFFVSSEEELRRASDSTDLKGLAISVSFYNTATVEVQREIEDLVSSIIVLKYRPVFLYGQPFDKELSNKILRVGNKVEDGSGCTPTAWAGIFPQEQDVGKICGADSKPRSEESFRKWLTDDWNDAKDIFLK